MDKMIGLSKRIHPDRLWPRTAAILADRAGLPAPRRSKWASDTQEYYCMVPLAGHGYTAAITLGYIDHQDSYASAGGVEAIVRITPQGLQVLARRDDAIQKLAELGRQVAPTLRALPDEQAAQTYLDICAEAVCEHHLNWPEALRKTRDMEVQK